MLVSASPLTAVPADAPQMPCGRVVRSRSPVAPPRAWTSAHASRVMAASPAAPSWLPPFEPRLAFFVLAVRPRPSKPAASPAAPSSRPVSPVPSSPSTPPSALAPSWPHSSMSRSSSPPPSPLPPSWRPALAWLVALALLPALPLPAQPSSPLPSSSPSSAPRAPFLPASRPAGPGLPDACATAERDGPPPPRSLRGGDPTRTRFPAVRARRHAVAGQGLSARTSRVGGASEPLGRFAEPDRPDWQAGCNSASRRPGRPPHGRCNPRPRPRLVLREGARQ